MTPTRRNFLKAAVAFCAAPLGFLLKKPLPDSFTFSRTHKLSGPEDIHVLWLAIKTVNSKWYRGYPPKSVIFDNFCAQRIASSNKWRFRFEFRQTGTLGNYRPVDFNLIDFGEEVPT